MKKISILLITALVVMTSYAQTSAKADMPAEMDNNVVYKLFPTQNMWTFIKLNTRTGQMWQVQFDVKDDNRLETFLSLLSLVPKEKEVNGRFTLYSTQNIYTFILLDQLDGRVWQVQWSTEFENRGIVPIN